MDAPDHIVLAEELGYRRAWVYDSPALYADVWTTLGRAAERTSRIGLATGVLIPSLRHPMVTAAAVATIEALAPGRFVMGIGSGFTGRLTLGQRPNRWAFVADYVRCVQALLRGEEPEWEGARIGMLQPAGFAAERPLEVPVVIGVAGPKGEAVARELADGVFVTQPRGDWDWCVALTFGTVLDDGEDVGSARVRQAAGHAAAVAVHGAYEFLGPAAADRIPGAPAWFDAIDAVPAERRHLEVHRGHLVELNEHDELVVTPELIASTTFTGTVEDLSARLADLDAAGVTEVAYQPAGDIERELRAFAQLMPT
jgi:5,10-methylenetetrahydromethanopterin reductase